MSELAEALRSLDDTRKQKNDVSRELKELKYAGVGACWESWRPGAWCPLPSGQGSPMSRACSLSLHSALLGQSVKCVRVWPLC